VSRDRTTTVVILSSRDTGNQASLICQRCY